MSWVDPILPGRPSTVGDPSILQGPDDVGIPELQSIRPLAALARKGVDQVLTGVVLTGIRLGGTSPVLNLPAGWSSANLVVSDTEDLTVDLTIPDSTAGIYSITFTTDDGTSNALSFYLRSGGDLMLLGVGQW